MINLNEYLNYLNEDHIEEKSFRWKSKLENVNEDELVLLCHGWKSGPAKLNYLANYLNKKGYAVYRFNLSTTFGRVSTIIEQTQRQLKSIDFGSNYKKVQFVGHSFGGIITKIILNRNKFDNADKFVTLGTPWDSTPFARKVEKSFNFGNDPALFGNGLKLLKVALAAKMQNTNLKVGLIGGDKPYTEKKAKTDGLDWDGTVPSQSAISLKEKVVAKKIVHLNHTELVNNPKTADMVIKFLKTAKF